MPVISVIIPVYNVEKYLRKCVDSVLGQTFKDIEIILVDDGSTDGCGKICDEYAEKDSRIRVIHKENGGLSCARNAGLDIARGEYIGFVDSDDYVSAEMYEKLLAAAKEYSANLICCNIMNVSENENGEEISCVSETCGGKRGLCLPNEILDDVKTLSVFYPSACNKLYSKEIFTNIRYPEGFWYEDKYVLLDIICAANAIVCIGDSLYYYYMRQGSIIHTAFNPKTFFILKSKWKQINFFIERGNADIVSLEAGEYIRDFLILYYRSFGKGKDVRRTAKSYLRDLRKQLKIIRKQRSICRLHRLMFEICAISPVLCYPLYRYVMK